MKHDILFKALGMKRGFGSAEEEAFAGFLAKELGTTRIDGAGNLHFDLRNVGSRTLFTAHTDTVHSRVGVNDFDYDEAKGHVKAKGSQLGADDGAGIAMLAHMIRSGVPGYYIMFRGEECGGIGSKWLARHQPELLGQFDRAVAFDRRGTSSVISHQLHGRCCSDQFAEALSDALNDQGLLYMPDATGLYTDTAEFVDIVPECTNVSVGYECEHSDKEWLDLKHLEALAAAVLKIDWDALPTSREPGDDGDFERFPIAENLADRLIEEAFLEAINGSNRELLEMVSQKAYPNDWEIAIKNVDLSYFEPEGLIDLCEYARTWTDALDSLTDDIHNYA